MPSSHPLGDAPPTDELAARRRQRDAVRAVAQAISVEAVEHSRRRHPSYRPRRAELRLVRSADTDAAAGDSQGPSTDRAVTA